MFSTKISINVQFKLGMIRKKCIYNPSTKSQHSKLIDMGICFTIGTVDLVF